MSLWFYANQVTINNGSTVVAVTSGEDISIISAGDGLIVGSFNPVEIKRAYIDGSNNKFIELALAWGDSNQSGVKARAYYTAGDFIAATKALQDANVLINDNFSSLDDWGSNTGSVSFINQAGETKTARTMLQMDADVQAIEVAADNLLGSMVAMTKAEFFARMEENKGYSGFKHWGKHNNYASSVNEGLWNSDYNAIFQSSLWMGKEDGSTGISETTHPVAVVNGATLAIKQVVSASTDYNQIKLPDAPDGTKTYDSATGIVTQHASAAEAFEAETATNTVITSRKDLVLLESWHEVLDNKVSPLGNVQYGASTWEGIALSNNVSPQGYAAFGEWDTVTKGYEAVWSSLTPSQQSKFIQDPLNNIYSDNGVLIQVKYRIRVIEGLGDSWRMVGNDAHNTAIRFSDELRVKPRGKQPSILGGDLDGWGAVTGERSYGWFVGKDSSERTLTAEKEGNIKGLYSALTTNSAGTGLGTLSADDFYGYKGECHLIQIGLVQRRNIGGHDKSLNPNGTSKFWNSDNTTAAAYTWEHASAKKPNSMADCFAIGNPNASGIFVNSGQGKIGTGDSGRPNGSGYHDAIYASDVQDLRMSSNDEPLAELETHYMEKARAGKIRGYEGVPFSNVFVAEETTSLTTTPYSLKLVESKVLGDTSWMSSSNTPCAGSAILSGVVHKITHAKIAGGDVFLVSPTFSSGGEVGSQVLQAVIGQVNLHKQANPTWTDIVGDPANILAAFPNGVEGQWIPELLENRVNLSRPFVSSQTNWRLLTQDLGATWTVSTSSLDSILNTTYALNNSTSVELLHYETQAYFTEDSVNSKVLKLGKCGANGSKDFNRGGLLVGSLIGKVPVGNYTGHFGIHGVPVTEMYNTVTDGTYIMGSIAAYDSQGLNHQPLDFPSVVDAPHAKYVDYVSVENGGAGIICLAYKEMIFDVDWGDNNQFEIFSNQVPFTDDNGNIGVRGTAKFPMQHFIKEGL